MVVNFFKAGLMQVRMGVFGPVVMSMGVLVLDMLVLMCGVRVYVIRLAVLMLVRMWCVVGVRPCHNHSFREMCRVGSRFFQLLAAGVS